MTFVGLVSVLNVRYGNPNVREVEQGRFDAVVCPIDDRLRGRETPDDFQVQNQASEAVSSWSGLTSLRQGIQTQQQVEITTSS
jgi:hypothetical protein